MATSSSNIEEEKGLLQKLFTGDRKAAALFFEQYGGLIRHAIGSVDVRSDTYEKSDLFHGAIEHLFCDDFKPLRLFSGRCSLGSYLYTVCRRHVLSVAGKENRLSSSHDTDSSLDSLAAAAEGDEEFLLDIEKFALKEAILKVNEESQIFIRMMFVDNCSTEEIMEFFGWGSANTVYAMKNKIMVKLKKAVCKKLVAQAVHDAV
jgi:RNA polymerase sigma factor (sigma-70 family)